MDWVIDGCGAFTAAYLDDLVIQSNTWKEDLHHIKSIFMRLCTTGLMAKPSKCQFGMKDCGYLGYVVGSGKVRPEVNKVNAVQSFAVPKTEGQV